MNKPLRDIGVLVTRADHQQSDIASLIENEGGTPYSIPLIKIDSPDSWKDADSAVSKIDSYDWILFTSVNAVDGFIGRVKYAGKDINHLFPKKIAAVGSKTKKRLEENGLKVSLQPKIYDGENLLKSFNKEDLIEKKILFPGAEDGRELLIDGLINIGAKVNSVPVYRTIPNDEVSSNELISLFEDGVIQVATFFSPSTFRVFLSHLPTKVAENTINKTVALAVIGSTTSKYVNGLGFKTEIVPEEHTAFGLIEAMKRWAESSEVVKNIRATQTLSHSLKE